MSWRDNLTEAQARLAALEDAELKLITGQQVRRASYDGVEIQYQDVLNLTAVKQAIGEVRMVISAITGGQCRRTGGVITPFLR